MKKGIGMKHKLTFSIIIRSTLFWFLCVIVLPFYSILALVIIKLHPRLRHRLILTAARYYNFLLKTVGGIKYTVTGAENIMLDKPAIYAGNHQSAWETMMLSATLPPCVWIMKREVFKIPLFGWAVAGMSTIAIDRSRGEDSLLQVIEQGKDRFALGFSIIMFPEGTRVRPTTRKPFKFGVGKLALSLDIPVVPIAHNSGYCLPKNSFWLYPGVVTVVIGKPIYPDGTNPVLFTEKIQAWVYAQLDEMRA